jgi:Uma2 family endonuclease
MQTITINQKRNKSGKFKRNDKATEENHLLEKNYFLDSLAQFENLDFNESLIFVPATLEEYYNLEEIKADYYEGNIVMSPASIQHERIIPRLIHNIYLFLDKKNIGELFGSKLTIVLGKYHFEPDITFIGNENTGTFTENQFIGTPDLIIEIISKSTKKYDMVNKREIYRKYKVKEIWFVDYNDNKIIIDYLEEDSYITKEFNIKDKISSRVLEGFTDNIHI